MSNLNFDTVFCNKCNEKTNHEIHFTKCIDGEDGPIDWYNLYQVLECRGCGNITFRNRLWFSEFQDFEPESDPVFRDKYYPTALIRKSPIWLDELENQNLTEVLKEVYSSFQNNLQIVTAIGIRTAFDIIAIEKINDIGSFDKKLNDLLNRKIITSDEKIILDTLIDSGNAAAHRGYSPSKDDIHILFDILEKIIEKIYFSENILKKLLLKSIELKNKIPKRKKI